MIGTCVQPAQARDHLDAVDAGQPEVEDDDVGVVARRERRARASPVRRQVDVVAAGREVDAERPQDLRLVVDDQDPGHDAHRDACGQRCSDHVSPPPGVSSTAISPPIASTKPRGHGEAEADTGAVRLVAEALERLEDALALVGRDARAAVDDAQVDPPPTAPASTRTDASAGDARERVVDDVGDRPLEQRGVGVHRAAASRRRRPRHAVARCAEPGERGRHDLLEADVAHHELERAGLQPAHVEQVADERR